jgi:small subunit ribosomal protein S17
LQGKVVSTKSTKTAVIAVETFVPHYLYKKRIRQTKRFQAHDEEEKCTVGDYVVIEPCRPISKTKRFTVGEILRKSDF